MTDEDLWECDKLRRLAGWNQTLEDWRRFLGLSAEGCFVAEREGKVVGSVTTSTYGAEMGWIGMLLVDPEFRGRGIGKTLLTRAISHLQQQGIGCIKLDATPKGEPLYRSMGFREEWPVVRFEGIAAAIEPASPLGGAIRAAREEDWVHIIELDAEAFGTKRGELIRAIGASALAVLVIEENGVFVGYGMVRAGSAANYLGPVAARSPEPAVKLSTALLQGAAGRPIYADVPKRNVVAMEWASTIFNPQRTLLRMFLGETNRTGDVTKYFALADPALG